MDKEKLSKALGIIEDVLEEEGILDYLLPATATYLAQLAWVCGTKDQLTENIEDNTYTAFINYGGDSCASVTVDFDLLPFLSILDGSGVAEPDQLQLYSSPKRLPESKELH